MLISPRSRRRWMKSSQNRGEEEEKGKRGRAERREEGTYLDSSLCPNIPRPLTLPSGIDRKDDG